MKNLYENLMNLQNENDKVKFYHKDFTTAFGTKCRLFAYHFVSYTDWLLPDALESRGIMFELDENENPVRIMCRPMEKFFNLGENPMTMDLDLSRLDYALTKEDGSLISTFHDKNILFTKSKTSITSSQAIESKQLLLDVKHKSLHDRCLELALNGFTCNFEYVAPMNRIVLQYDEPKLILLNVRNNETGEYVNYSELYADNVLRPYLVEIHKIIPEYADQMIEEIRQMTDIEGYVFKHLDGIQFKLKTEWYSNLHRMKDTLNNNEALFTIVVGGASDDIKSLYNDEWSKTKIEKFENIFYEWLKTNSKYVLDLNKSLAGLDRKSYAIGGQTKMKNDNKLELFSVLMEIYKGSELEQTMNNLNMVFLKNYKTYVPEEYVVSKSFEND